MKRLALMLFLAAGLAAAGSCQGLGDLFGGLKKVDDALNSKEGRQAIESGKKIGAAVQKSAEDITPEQEYYIGRSVSASILAKYKVWRDDDATRYLNVLAAYLAQYCTKPVTYGGYHVAILDSDQVNAFGAPGGFILVTRGMLRCCASESELAAVLAHEIGHIENQHGLKAIKTDRLTTVFTVTAQEAAANSGSGEVKELTQAFGGSIGDITKTLVNNGYSKELEFQADKSAVATLKAAGYNPDALVGMLERMKGRLKPGAPDFAKTHPAPDQRIKQAKLAIGPAKPVAEPAALPARFQAALSGN